MPRKHQPSKRWREQVKTLIASDFHIPPLSRTVLVSVERDMSEPVVLVLFAAPFVAVVIMVLAMWREHRSWSRVVAAEVAKRTTLESRFSKIVDADAEAASIVEVAENSARQREEAAQKTLASLNARNSALAQNVEDLRQSYSEKKAVYDRLAKQVAIFDERLAFAEMGVYEPHFDFDSSEEYKSSIEAVRERQKSLVTAKSAVICRTAWTVDGSAAKGKTMSDRAIRLTLRAFNSECDAAIANTRWNNANAMEKRIENARNQIDKHNASNAVEITDRFFDLKIEELRLTHEYREKLKEEKEERLEASRASREEQKLIREMEQAEEEEARYQRLLDKAHAEAAKAVGPKLDAFSQKIAMLEQDLAEAHAKAERARAMAEMTKSGYVYIISNIGSFGPDLVKIGLTRRLDPADRVRELGDASVPFLFDTHAIIYSDEAPALERALHQEFAKERVNATNFRKEFFRVSLDQVEGAVRRLAPAASFFRDVEAQEYRETMALRNAQLAAQHQQVEAQFPSFI
ncbi:DUF4041 domain-containing protein [Devosia sp. 1635]|uniref:DUF4041 domain-containing protein n=1 Tax=Devosia sp. 1635 TaxID=2726066 RepID=UPI0020C134EB|nr:DUF4041 domain-containing protein [Devosia sp. 1635]